MSDWWNIGAGTTGAAGTGEPVVRGQAEVTATEIADGAVKTAELADLNVTSEKASATLVRKSITVPIPIDPIATATTYGSTDLLLWVPPTAVVLERVRLLPLTAWQLATCGEGLDIWSTGTGRIAVFCSSSTGVAKTAGVPVAFGALVGTAIAACEPIRIGAIGISACSDLGLGSIQIDYLTTG